LAGNTAAQHKQHQSNTRLRDAEMSDRKRLDHYARLLEKKDAELAAVKSDNTAQGLLIKLLERNLEQSKIDAEAYRGGDTSKVLVDVELLTAILAGHGFNTCKQTASTD
jgi:hypothetical protein